MASAGTGARVRVTTTDTGGSSADEINGCNSINFERARELLETTDFSDAANGKSVIAGLKGYTFSLGMDYETTSPQSRLETALGDGSSVWIGFLTNGTVGWRVECKVGKYSVSATPQGKVEATCDLTCTAAVTAV